MQPLRFARYAWSVLALNLGVVLWGAYVRATGSGAGCGSHWPLCNGEVVPRAPRVETVIEFTHRVSSGLALISVGVLVLWAFRAFPARHRARKAATASLALILVEALLGAGLVLFHYVAQNASAGRAIYLSAHLVNTLLLLGALALAAWWGSPRKRATGPVRAPAAVALAATLVLGITGAIAALGDTLFPAVSFGAGLRQDFAAASHVLLRLRLIHPVVSALVGTYLLVAALAMSRAFPAARHLGWWVAALVMIQSAAGIVNLLLLAPVWMQLVHLLIADLLWIALVLFAAEARRPDLARG